MNSPNKNKYSSFQKLKTKTLLLFLIVLNNFGSFEQTVDPDGYNKFYYPDGALASEGMFKSGKPDGIWKTYYADGTLKSIGKKAEGLSDSTWAFFDEAGRQVWKYEYYKDKKNGCAQRFDSLGFVSEEFFYLNDVVQGEKTWFYSNGDVKKTGYFDQGKQSGLCLEYDNEGKVVTEEVYDNGYLKDRTEFNRLDEDGKKTGIWRDYYPDGTIKSETTYQHGQKNGISKTYNLKGKLIEIQDMTSDTTTKGEVQLMALYKEYYPGGKIKIVGGLSEGQKSGIYREYDMEGNLVNGYIYRHDTLVSEGMILFDGTYQGSWRDYYSSGIVADSGTYAAGVRDGKWIFYYENGLREQEGSFRNNQPFGSWSWYYQNGQLKRRETYNAYGKLEGTVTEYDSLGNEIARGDYYNGLQEGPWFYQVGDHKEVGSFTVGKPDGAWTYYYLNGNVAFRGAYEEGEPKGRHTYYHLNGVKKMSGKYVGGVKHGIWRTYDTMGEETEEILYRNGEIVKINGFKVEPVEAANK